MISPEHVAATTNMTIFQTIIFCLLFVYHGALFLIYLGNVRNTGAIKEALKPFGFGLFDFYLEFIITIVCIACAILVAASVIPLFFFITCVIGSLLYYISFDIVHKTYSKFKMFFNCAAVISLLFFLRSLNI